MELVKDRRPTPTNAPTLTADFFPRTEAEKIVRKYGSECYADRKRYDGGNKYAGSVNNHNCATGVPVSAKCASVAETSASTSVNRASRVEPKTTTATG